MYVRQYMTTGVITITSDTAIYDAQMLMRENRVHHLPVVDEKGKLIGLLTDSRLKKVVSLLASSLTAGQPKESLLNVKAGNMMASNVVTISPDASLAEAAALGLKDRIGALPVVDKDGEMVGIITTTDLIKALTQILSLGGAGVLLDFAGTVDQVKLREVIEIIHKHQATIIALFRIRPPQAKEEHLVIRVHVDNVVPIKEELRVRGYLCTITSL